MSWWLPNAIASRNDHNVAARVEKSGSESRGFGSLLRMNYRPASNPWSCWRTFGESTCLTRNLRPRKRRRHSWPSYPADQTSRNFVSVTSRDDVILQPRASFRGFEILSRDKRLTGLAHGGEPVPELSI